MPNETAYTKAGLIYKYCNVVYDGATLIPRQAGRNLAWDVTVVNSLADSYQSRTAISTGATNELVAHVKVSKYERLSASYPFIPLAFETIGPINGQELEFITSLGHQLTRASGDPRETSFLIQRVASTIQRFNAITFQCIFEERDICEDQPS